MKISKVFKKAIYAVATLFVLFFAILIYHIATAKPPVYENAHVQVSRIDFKSDIDPVQSKKICKDLRSIKGLTSDSIIVRKNMIVYFHNNTITNSQKVYNQLMRKGNYDAVPYILPASLANKSVCPVDRNSFSYKMSKKVNQFFN